MGIGSRYAGRGGGKEGLAKIRSVPYGKVRMSGNGMRFQYGGGCNQLQVFFC